MHPRFQGERMDAARAKIKAAVEKLAKERGVTVDLPGRRGRDVALNNLYLWEDLAAAVEKVAAAPVKRSGKKDAEQVVELQAEGGEFTVADEPDEEEREPVRCVGTTASGEQCKRWASEGSDRCAKHQE